MSDLNRFTGLVRRCVEDYNMIQDGDKIAVGVSGGKDSVSLLCALSNLKRYYPKNFELCAISVAMGFEEMDFSPIQKLCDELNVPYYLRKTQMKEIIFEQRKEKNPCALCAKMRRGAIHDVMHELGVNKVAFGHHFDDAVETFMMSLFYEGRISCFQPVTYMSRAEVTQIRPMLYVGEGTVKNLVERYKLPVVENPCPMDKHSKREDVKTLIRNLSTQYPDLKTKVFGAIQRLPLDGWEPSEYTRRPLP